jgi:hypothetical protein
MVELFLLLKLKFRITDSAQRPQHGGDFEASCG